MPPVRFRALDLDVELQVEDPGLKDLLRAVTGTYGPAQGPPDLTWRFETEPWPKLLRGGALIYQCKHAIDLVPFFELDLYRRVIEHSRAGLLLHGAALGEGTHALVLVGPSGAGKSTMAQALLARGRCYLTDECLAIDARGQVRGLTRPINPGPGPVRPPPPGAMLHRYSFHDQDYALVETTLLHPPAGQLSHAPWPIGAIVRLRYAPLESPGPRRLSSAEALVALWAECWRKDPDALPRAAALLERHVVHELVTRDVDEACEHLLALWSGAASVPGQGG